MVWSQPAARSPPHPTHTYAHNQPPPHPQPWQDGALSDEELNEFQCLCFGQELSEEELANVKAMVAERMPEGISDAVRGCVVGGEAVGE